MGLFLQNWRKPQPQHRRFLSLPIGTPEAGWLQLIAVGLTLHRTLQEFQRSTGDPGAWHCPTEGCEEPEMATGLAGTSVTW
jgi:hypothetical protein